MLSFLNILMLLIIIDLPLFRYVNENSSAYGIVFTPLDYDYLWTANSYGTAIPGGWLLALPYLRDNAHVRLIIPSKMGHTYFATECDSILL